MKKIIYYAPITNMGSASETDAQKYRNWAKRELENRFPEYEIVVSADVNIFPVWTVDSDIEDREEIQNYVHRLWNRYPEIEVEE